MSNDFAVCLSIHKGLRRAPRFVVWMASHLGARAGQSAHGSSRECAPSGRNRMEQAYGASERYELCQPNQPGYGACGAQQQAQRSSFRRCCL